MGDDYPWQETPFAQKHLTACAHGEAVGGHVGNCSGKHIICTIPQRIVPWGCHCPAPATIEKNKSSLGLPATGVGVFFWYQALQVDHCRKYAPSRTRRRSWAGWRCESRVDAPLCNARLDLYCAVNDRHAEQTHTFLNDDLLDCATTGAASSATLPTCASNRIHMISYLLYCTVALNAPTSSEGWAASALAGGSCGVGVIQTFQYRFHACTWYLVQCIAQKCSGGVKLACARKSWAAWATYTGPNSGSMSSPPPHFSHGGGTGFQRLEL